MTKSCLSDNCVMDDRELKVDEICTPFDVTDFSTILSFFSMKRREREFDKYAFKLGKRFTLTCVEPLVHLAHVWYPRLKET